MVLITPRLVQPLEPDEVPPLPTDEPPAAAAEDLAAHFEDAGLADAPALANQNQN